MPIGVPIGVDVVGVDEAVEDIEGVVNAGGDWEYLPDAAAMRDAGLRVPDEATAGCRVDVISEGRRKVGAVVVMLRNGGRQHKRVTCGDAPGFCGHDWRDVGEDI